MLWGLAALLACFNLAGGMVGARMALKQGERLRPRGAVTVVVVSLVVKLGYDQWLS